MSSFNIFFSVDPPDKASLIRILSGVQWDASEAGINVMLKHRPHPSLFAVWAILMYEEAILGFATLYLPPPQSLDAAPVFIGNFVVESTSHRRGNGSYLLGQLELWCQEKGVKTLALQTVDSSTSFFMAKGFCKNKQYPDFLFKTLGAFPKV